jgi:aminomethyltransferase
MAPASGLRRTPFHDLEVSGGARLIEFNGWELPVQYSGILEEHHSVRDAAGLFDVSHMGKIIVQGPGAHAFLERLSPNTISTKRGAARYTHLLRDDGTIIDDVIVTCLDHDDYLMVCNAGPHPTVLEWLREHAQGQDVRDVTTDVVCLALQGPRAERILQTLTTFNLASLGSFRGGVVEVIMAEGFQTQVRGAPYSILLRSVPVEIEGWGSHTPAFLRDFGLGGPTPRDPAIFSPSTELCLVTRTGYTGEDGFELFAPNAVGRALWGLLHYVGDKYGLRPCGLGARDTLRMEMGYLLSGQDFDGSQTTLQTGYDWVVKWDHDFIGRRSLERQRNRGDYTRWGGLVLEERGVPRHGCKILADGTQVGTVTSGTLSPTLRRGIALGYVGPEHAVPGTKLTMDIRGRGVPARVVKTPFIKPRKASPA